MEAELVSSKVGDENYVSPPIDILSGNNVTVTFKTHQVWSPTQDTSISTLYTSTEGPECTYHTDLQFGYVETHTAVCVDGVATVELFVHSSRFSNYETVSVPASCTVPDDVASSLISYKYSLPCSPKCVPTDGGTWSPTKSPTAFPTHSPSAGPTDSPTAMPTDSPTASPTSSPTSSPSGSPTSAPTVPLCIDAMKASLTASVSGPAGYTCDPIQILYGSGDNVTFELHQCFTPSDATWIAVEHECVSEGSWICDRHEGVAPGHVDTYTAMCDENKTATVNVFVSDPMFNNPEFFDLPEYCSSDGYESYNDRIMFSFVLPCSEECVDSEGGTWSPTTSPTAWPTASPTTATPTTSPTPGPSDATVTVTEEEVPPPAPCVETIETTFLNSTGPLEWSGPPLVPVSTDGSTVTVDIYQTLKSSSVSWVAVDRLTGDGSGDCTKTNTVAPGYHGRYVAECHGGSAKVNVYFHDGQFRNPNSMIIPGRCSPSNDQAYKKILFSYTVSCESTCVQTNGGTLAPTSEPTMWPTKAPVTPAPTPSPTQAPVAPAPTPSPTKAPTKSPTEAPTVQSNCIEAMIPELKSSAYGNHPPAGPQIEIVEGTGDTVTFNVHQLVKGGAISWLATDRVDAATGDQSCTKINSVASGFHRTYIAKCANEVTTVTLYMHDGQFNNQEFINIPSRCEPSQDQYWKKIMFTYELPCSSTCVETEGGTWAPTKAVTAFPTMKPTDSPTKAPTTTANTNAAPAPTPAPADCPLEAKLQSTDGVSVFASNPIQITGYGQNEVTFDVLQTWKYSQSTGSASISWIMTYYECPTGGYQCPKVNGVVQDQAAGSYTAKCDPITHTATVEIVAHDGQFSDSLDTASVPDPAICNGSNDQGGKVGYVFEVPCAPYLSNFCVDESVNLNVATCGADVFDTFQAAGAAASWTHGTVSESDGFSKFLGRFGQELPEMSKSFSVPSSASSVSISFDFYDIDGPLPGDKVEVGISGSYFDLDLFSGATSSGGLHSDVSIVKSKSAAHKIGFQYEKDDSKYHVSINVPNKWYGTTLPLSFRVTTGKSINVESYGIDNLRIHANCARREQEVEESAEDGSSYCSAKDYPCEGNGMVHVCHYSSKLGYQTFCIPEADSEVLRFYSHDYCGPCASAYGTM